MKRPRHVIWDFNGTLLDDVDCCVATLNDLLARRAMAPLTRQRYLERFGFPVRDFYVTLGFDFERERFDDVSREYIAGYVERVGEASVHAGARETLRALDALEITQSVLSAMQDELLQRLLRDFELDQALCHVRGLEHLHASSKLAQGRSLLDALDAGPDEVLLVGDTLHDLEVARALGCRCLLYCRGHQSPGRLRAARAELIDTLDQVLDAL